MITAKENTQSVHMTDAPPPDDIYTPGLSNEEWHKLPMALRRRWWKETQYGTVKPSDELMLTMWKAAGRE